MTAPKAFSCGGRWSSGEAMRSRIFHSSDSGTSSMVSCVDFCESELAAWSSPRWFGFGNLCFSFVPAMDSIR
jgi:hypothetical protein